MFRQVTHTQETINRAISNNTFRQIGGCFSQHKEVEIFGNELIANMKRKPQKIIQALSRGVLMNVDCVVNLNKYSAFMNDGKIYIVKS